MRKRKQRGMTLMELMILIGILGVVVSVGFVGCRAALTGDSVEKGAEAEARLWASKLKLPIDGISCANIASRKGLVGCTVRSGSTVYQLECIGRYYNGHGCREQKLSVPSQGQLE